MSLNDEKYRALRQLPDIIHALLLSKKNKISTAWREQLYYGLKHYPWPSDKISVNNYTENYKSCKSFDDILEFVKLIDQQSVDTKKKRKPNKK